MLRKTLFVLFVCCILSPSLWAQDPQFGHFYSNAMLYNPAFAGNVEEGRVILSYRNQWPKIEHNFISYAAGYEHNFSDANSGVGVLFSSDRAGSGGLTDNAVNFMYSYRMPLDREFTLMAGIKAGLHYRFFNMGKFIFADQIARNDYSSPSAAANSLDEKSIFPNFGTGAVLHHLEKFWIGLSFDHINRPKNGFQNKDGVLNPSIALQGGWNFPLSSGGGYYSASTSKITIASLYKHQGKWNQVDIGSYFTNEYVLFGLWYRGIPFQKTPANTLNQDAIMGVVGFIIEDFSFAYSYDFTISSIIGYTGGAHELSIAYDIKSKKGKRRGTPGPSRNSPIPRW